MSKATVLRISNGRMTRMDVPPETLGDLKWLQGQVGGYIEVVDREDQIVVLGNEEGRMLGLAPNVERRDGIVLVGKLLVVGAADDGNFRGLTEAEAERIKLIGVGEGIPFLEIAPS